MPPMARLRKDFVGGFGQARAKRAVVFQNAQGTCQSAKLSPGTRLNSVVLWLTRVSQALASRRKVIPADLGFRIRLDRDARIHLPGPSRGP
jgi:hypothetical protein